MHVDERHPLPRCQDYFERCEHRSSQLIRSVRSVNCRSSSSETRLTMSISIALRGLETAEAYRRETKAIRCPVASLTSPPPPQAATEYGTFQTRYRSGPRSFEHPMHVHKEQGHQTSRSTYPAVHLTPSMPHRAPQLQISCTYVNQR